MGEDYIRLDPYTHQRTKIRILHKKCGIISDFNPSNTLYNGCKCPICFKTRKYSDSEVKNLIDIKTDGRFEYIGSGYKNNKSYIDIIHKSSQCKCKNRPFKTKLNTILFYNTTSCPYCNMSSGEEKISKILDDLKIEYEYQVKLFDSLFMMDFYIPSKNIFLEYDGKQHFESIKDWDFERQLERDFQKNFMISNSKSKLMERSETIQLGSTRKFLEKVSFNIQI